MMTRGEGHRVYEAAVAMLDTMPEHEHRAGNHDIIVVHERANHGTHPNAESCGGRIFEASLNCTALLGRRTERIVMDRSLFFSTMERNDAESRHRRRWMREMLMLKLTPGGQFILL